MNAGKITRAMIVCDSPKAAETYSDILKKEGISDILACSGGAEAKRKILEKEVDVVLVNSPLRKESAESTAIDIASKNACQVILMVKNEYYEETWDHTSDYGVITVGKPVHMQQLRMGLSFAYIAQRRIAMANNEKLKLQKKLNEVKLVNQAKLLLMQNEGLTEEEAHKKIERYAMNDRLSRAAVAKEIIYRYE